MSVVTTTRELDGRARVTLPAKWIRELSLETKSEVLLVYRPVLQEVAIKKLQIKEVY